MRSNIAGDDPKVLVVFHLLAAIAVSHLRVSDLSVAVESIQHSAQFSTFNPGVAARSVS